MFRFCTLFLAMVFSAHVLANECGPVYESIIDEAYIDHEITVDERDMLTKTFKAHPKEDYEDAREWHDAIMDEIEKETNGEKNQGVAKVVAKVVKEMVKSSPAHAATHDGRGNCNAGCGRGR